jgi:hypothetical protein
MVPCSCTARQCLGAENASFAPFIYKTIFLPRQARDKHRETALKTQTRFALGRGRTISERTRNTSVCISRNNNDNADNADNDDNDNADNDDNDNVLIT